MVMKKTLQECMTLCTPQVQWIKKDLAANKNKDWVIAYWHHPPFTMGSHNSDKEDELVKIRENFIRILEREGVDLVVCGHSHLYERSKLINGHYGLENTFNDKQHSVSNSTAFYNGSHNSCPYIKSTNVTTKGTVLCCIWFCGSTSAAGYSQATHMMRWYIPIPK